jgi:hypothetical protein
MGKQDGRDPNAFQCYVEHILPIFSTSAICASLSIN